MALALACALPLTVISCSKDDDNPENTEQGNNPGGSDQPEEPDDQYSDITFNFSQVPSSLIGGPTSYGANLYYGAEDQITTGYFAQLSEEIYAQFSINYGSTFDSKFNPVWGYSYFQGGMAISDWHDMEEGNLYNQLSVYHPLSPSGKNFIVDFGYATDANYVPVTNPNSATLADYADCGRVYITDSEGYTVTSPGMSDTRVNGKALKAIFQSVSLMNTTYVYKTMEEGNDYAQALNEENKGWMKVQFIAFDNNLLTAKPTGYVEAYLANFDPALEEAAGYCGKILNDWTRVDLSSLGEISILVVNFVGSDTGEYGLNTPTYCALDGFVISVEK